jgi:hypothetical protein
MANRAGLRTDVHRCLHVQARSPRKQSPGALGGVCGRCAAGQPASRDRSRHDHGHCGPRRAQERRDPQSIQILDRAEIEEQLKFSGNAAAALAKLVPGYSMPTQTVSSASENYRGRDLLVMLDGVPMNTPLRDVSRILSA